MADISEAEAILHLKRALGEIDAGDALPPPLPVLPKAAPPPAKVPKTAPERPKMATSAPPMMASIGPTPRNEVRVPSQPTPAPPPKAQQGAIRPGPGMQMRPPAPPGMQGAMPPVAPGLVGQPGMQNMKMPGLPTGPMPPGFPGMPSAPGMAPMRPPGQATGGAAAAAAAAMGPGKNQKQFEIPQGKVGLVLGKNSATLNAIKAYSKAQCFIEQKSPDEDKATVFAVGSDREIAKCKQTILAVVDGSMSVSTLFTLAGVPLPRGGAGEWEGPPPSTGAADHGAAAAAAAWGAHPGMMPGAPTMPIMPGGMAPPMPPMMLQGMAAPGMPPVPTGVQGMPENQQMQQNLNDYYARWWSTYASQQQGGKEGGGADEDLGDGTAFDKDALARLADRAAKGLVEEPAPRPAAVPAPQHDLPPGPPPEAAGGFCSECGAPYTGSPNFCSSCGSKLNRPEPAPQVPPPPSSSGLQSSAGGAGAAPGDANAGSSMSGPAPGTSALSQPGRGPITLKGFLRPAEPQKARKDDDSVQQMMDRFQGNVQQTKQTIATSEAMPQPPRPPMRNMGMGMLAEEDPRTRADFEFEALMSRMQSTETPDEVEHVGREVLIRFPAYNPQQVADLMGKMNSCPALLGYQNGEILAELCRMVLPRLKEFTSTQFTSLVSTVASWARRSDRPRSTRFQDFSKACFNAASVEMSSRLMTFAPHELNCCLAAFVSVGFSEHKFFASVGRAALARHSSFAPVQLTALLAILSEMRLMHTDLFNAAGAFLSSRAKELRPVDITRVLRSFAKCNVQHQVLCKSVADEVVSRARDKTAAATFKAEDLCEIGWALCVMQHYHEPIFRLLFKALEKVPTIACESLLQLYELHLTLDTEYREAYERYRPERHLLEALEDHYKDNRKDERRCSERLRNDVASVLKSLVDGSVHVNHRTSLGLLVDVVALRKRSSADGFIHVDLDSAMTTVRSLDQDEPTQAAVVTEGSVSLRRRMLSKTGMRLVAVKESEWRDLDDSKDKRRYLRNLLASLGDVLQ